MKYDEIVLLMVAKSCTKRMVNTQTTYHGIIHPSTGVPLKMFPENQWTLLGLLIEYTIWLCQNSYWKWPFIVNFPVKMVIFQ